MFNGNMKRKFKNAFIALIVLYVISVAISVFAEGIAILDAFTHSTTLIITGIGLLGILMYVVSTNRHWIDDQEGYAGKTQSGKEMDQHYEARFVTEQELLTNPVFMPTTWKQLPKVKKTGVMIRSLYKGGTMHINMYNPIHTLIIGTTGSGKTTTLYSAINEINVVGDKILTAEDPVEYDIDGIVQVPINDAVGMTFEKALRAFLRQDPDRILVGEIRDFITAQIAVEASLTGHFVFSTLHTNDSASTVTRLVDMGLEPFLICSSLVGVLSQRLLRRVCYACKTPYTPSDEELERLEISREDVAGRPFYYGKGCQICKNTGYKGRKAICELMVMTNDLAELIYRGAPTLEIQNKAIAQGMRTMREDGMISIYNGETSVDEVLRYT